ncbi:hypothetical protein Poli38472_002543 [Pythium oligandrum]|uniref:Ubiquitin carboxyl-terminal hydrolase n=1 Tax=Pythium oligandrum TaxID=41045 RepID=A0A8K1FL91_PYTOL|nr:hypothetical protein Poli38472_002543 [Pythium oligandrum]|eukprot:TMW63602.1 hypothetical protein Poli38472_002543 [Pythium oligandrum]
MLRLHHDEHAHGNGSASHVRPAQRYVVPGLQNLGNTCFFNAILQALAAVGSFPQYLDEVVEESEERGKHIPFTRALRDCIHDLTPVPSEAGSPSAVVPKRLNQELCTKLASFRGNKQQDSQELLQFLINIVNDEQKRCARSDGGLKDLFPSSLAPFSGSISDLCFEDALEERRWNPLYGLQVDLLQCSGCARYRPMTNRRFLDVSLSFGDAVDSKKPITLWDCLRMYTAPEVISGVECTYCTANQELMLKRRDCKQLELEYATTGAMETELEVHQIKEDIYTLENLLAGDAESLYQLEISDSRCRALRDRYKRLQFSRCPDVFCFHFNRKVFHYSGHARKLDTHVVFPIELDMSPFCRYEQSSHENGRPLDAGMNDTRRHLVYELVAVILHHGNERYGHFTAFRRVRATRQWFFISDDNVREAREDEVLSSCAYMLFYERKYRRRSATAKTNGHDKRAPGNGKPLSDEESEDEEAALARVPDESSLR